MQAHKLDVAGPQERSWFINVRIAHDVDKQPSTFIHTSMGRTPSPTVSRPLVRVGDLT